jgi:hypothetical protein
MRLRSALLLVLLPLTLAAAPQSQNLPPHRAADPNAAVVTHENLLASERFWPYQVSLTKAWEGVPAGSTGVLIRVEASEAARIDFGRDGLHLVPVSATDVVDRAERVRRGELEKTAPNFTLAIGPRLLDSASQPLRPVSFAAALERRGFLAVFADPTDPKLAEVADALAELGRRRELMTVYFPQGNHTDAQVHERLRNLGWPVAFVFDHLSEGYTASLIDPQIRRPALLLQTEEGRVLFQGTWSPSAVSGLSTALEAAFGNGAATAAAR